MHLYHAVQRSKFLFALQHPITPGDAPALARTVMLRAAYFFVPPPPLQPPRPVGSAWAEPTVISRLTQ